MNGALVNRAVSEAQTGSPTRGGRPGTMRLKEMGNGLFLVKKSLQRCLQH